MKFKLVLLLALVVGFANAQQIQQPEAPDFKYTEVRNCELSAKDMYENALDWVITQIAETPNMVFADSISKKIIVDACYQLPKRHDYSNSTERPFLYFKMSLEFKDGRYRMVLDNFGIIERVTTVLLDYNTHEEKYTAQDIFDFDDSPWMNRASAYELALNELKAVDPTSIKKKERKEMESEMYRLQERIDSEVSSADSYRKLSHIHKSAVNDFLPKFSDEAERIISKKREEW